MTTVSLQGSIQPVSVVLLFVTFANYTDREQRQKIDHIIAVFLEHRRMLQLVSVNHC